MIKLSKKLTSAVTKTVVEYNLIEPNDKIIVGLSGGKDSFSLLYLLDRMQKMSNFNFEILAVTVNYGFGEDLSLIQKHLENNNIEYLEVKTDIYKNSDKYIKENSSYCSYFSRMRRGVLYRVAIERGFNKVALGHHLDDAVESFFMNMLNNGKLRSMPPKYTTEDKKLQIIRPMIQIREHKLEECAKENSFPLIPPDSCPSFTKGVKEPTARADTKKFLYNLEKEHKDLFSKLKTSFTNVQINTFSTKFDRI